MTYRVIADSDHRGSKRLRRARYGLPLRNNLLENDIREYTRMRKIGSGARSGTSLRQHFYEPKNTSRKLGVSLGAFLQERLSGSKQMPQLSERMRQFAAPRSARIET
jgi:hypothetical protein